MLAEVNSVVAIPRRHLRSQAGDAYSLGQRPVHVLSMRINHAILQWRFGRLSQKTNHSLRVAPHGVGHTRT